MVTCATCFKLKDVSLVEDKLADLKGAMCYFYTMATTPVTSTKKRKIN